MLQASSRLSSMFSRRQKDFCFFCSSRRTHLGQGTDFSLHSEWKTAPQLSHLQKPMKNRISVFILCVCLGVVDMRKMHLLWWRDTPFLSDQPRGQKQLLDPGLPFSKELYVRRHLKSSSDSNGTHRPLQVGLASDWASAVDQHL